MTRALRLLLWLRFVGWLRYLGRTMRTWKGAVLALLGALVFLPWLLSTILMYEPGTPEHLESVRRFGPLALLAYCVITLAFSSGESAITFSPAEVNFLFSGPFTRRQILAYKILGSLKTVVLTALFLTIFLRQHAVSTVAAFVGLLLAMCFVQLFTMVIALLASSIGVRAYNRRRKLILVPVAGVIAVSLFSLGGDLPRLGPGELVERVQQTPVLRIGLAPLRWFIEAFTAERRWPDLVQWGALSLLVDGLLLGLVFALDSHYLESAAASSERIYAMLQRVRSGGPAAVPLHKSARPRWSLPSLPWWGGIGPIAWRQITTVPRSRGPLVTLLVVGAVLIGPALASLNERGAETPAALVLAGIVLWITVFLTPLIPYDFRGDLDRIDYLKTLPIAPWALVIGQLVAPVLLVLILQWLALALLILLKGQAGLILWGVAALALPFDFLLFAIENLLFLWFPARLTPATPGDMQNLGRHMLLFLAKFLGIVVAAALAALPGALAYLLLGHSLFAGLAAAWVVLTACALGVVPLVALAFRQFDVARDTPP